MCEPWGHQRSVRHRTGDSAVSSWTVKYVSVHSVNRKVFPGYGFTPVRECKNCIFARQHLPVTMQKYNFCTPPGTFRSTETQKSSGGVPDGKSGRLPDFHGLLKRVKHFFDSPLRAFAGAPA
jgi:hypothetical protein